MEELALLTPDQHQVLQVGNYLHSIVTHALYPLTVGNLAQNGGSVVS